MMNRGGLLCNGGECYKLAPQDRPVRMDRGHRDEVEGDSRSATQYNCGDYCYLLLS